MAVVAKAIIVVDQAKLNFSVKNPDSSGPIQEPREYPDSKSPDTIPYVSREEL